MCTLCTHVCVPGSGAAGECEHTCDGVVRTVRVWTGWGMKGAMHAWRVCVCAARGVCLSVCARVQQRTGVLGEWSLEGDRSRMRGCLSLRRGFL